MTDRLKPFTLGDRYFPDNKDELQKVVDRLFMEIPTEYNYSSRVIFSPHGAYKYSGKIAANVFQYLDKNLKNIFIVSPAHFLMFYGLYLSTYSKWSTPLGEVDVNQELLRDINENFDADYNDRAYENEHDIDVQLPIVRTLFPEAKIVPILFGNSNYRVLLHLLDKYWTDKENGFVFVPDLSHFYSEENAMHVDEVTAYSVEQNERAVPNKGLGSTALIAVTEFARERNYSLIRVDLGISGEIAGSDAKVQGYGAWFLAEETAIDFVKKEFSDIVATICRNSIISALEFSQPILTENLNLAPIFSSRRASFIELYVDDEKRGESGTFFAYQSLAEDLATNAFKAAVHSDKPLQKDEIERMHLKIFLLSRPVEVAFDSEEKLISQIDPDNDGLILRDGDKDVTVMPGTSRNSPSKEAFFESITKRISNDANLHSKMMIIFKFRVSEIDI